MQGMHYYGGAVASDPREKSKGWLTAIDASTGKERWKYASPTPLVAGVTATSGGVLFTGDLNNDFLALDAKTGEVLYRFNTGGSIGGGVITYALDGKQYAATVSGTVSAFFGGSGLPAVVIFAGQKRRVPAQAAAKPSILTRRRLPRWIVSATRPRICSCGRPKTICPAPTSRSISTADRSSRKGCRPAQASRCAITISTSKPRCLRRFTSSIAKARRSRSRASSTSSTRCRARRATTTSARCGR